MCGIALAAPADADDSKRVPDAEVFEQALPEGGSLTGREIYRRFLDNRARTSSQNMQVISRDAGGSAQTTRFRVKLEDLRDEEDQPQDGLRARMLVEVDHPFDMRHTAYLMISKDPGPDDEFVYQPSERRVRRVDLRRTPLMGTDYTFDDIMIHDIDDAEYVRGADEVIDGVAVYVIEAQVLNKRDTEYHRTLSYLEQEHYIPLKVRYWDEYGVEMKQLHAPHAKLRAFDDVWVASESTMRDLLQGTESTLLIDDLDLDVEFPPNAFNPSRLTRGH